MRLRLKQDGQVVAAVEGFSAWAEICHYAMLYSKEGPVEIEEHRAGRWRKVRK